MTNKSLKPTYPALITAIDASTVSVRIEDATIMLPKKLFTDTIAVGDKIHIGIFDEAAHSHHHAKLSKSILNTIFGGSDGSTRKN